MYKKNAEGEYDIFMTNNNKTDRTTISKQTHKEAKGTPSSWTRSKITNPVRKGKDDNGNNDGKTTYEGNHFAEVDKQLYIFMWNTPGRDQLEKLLARVIALLTQKKVHLI